MSKTWDDATDLVELLGFFDNFNERPSIFNSRQTVLGVVLTFLILAWICAALRIWTRLFVVRVPGWDDLCVVLAVLSITTLSVGTCISLDHGLGKHFLHLSIDQMRDFIHSFYIANAAYPTATAFIKLALLFQYLRVFEPGSKLRTATYVTIVVTALWGVSYAILGWVPCLPVSAYWDRDVQGTCYAFGSQHPRTFFYTYVSHVGSNVLLDLIVFGLPTPLYFRKELTSKGRKGLLGLFVLGVIVNILSICRLVSIVATRAGTYPTFDPSWYGASAIVLSALEIDFAAICACLPVFWPVLHRNLGRIFVTHEVNVTHELRRFSLQPDEGGAPWRGTAAPISASAPAQQHQRYADPLVRWHLDPLSRVKGSTTVVESSGQWEELDEEKHPDPKMDRKMARQRKESKDSLLSAV